MLRLNGIIGFATDAALAEPLHRLEHAGAVEYLVLDREDTLRHRVRARTDHGTECAIALARDQHLADGSVLVLEPARAIVVRMREESWLALAPRDAAAALELGYHAGNLHWRVRFAGERLLVAREGPVQAYLDRLAPLIAAGKVRPADE
ncbi:MAG: urease accessory protein UreE [Alphaproteobacteria bacterium]|nr:urease accessory protein UreE [Alphaproteobacteria bacterium]